MKAESQAAAVQGRAKDAFGFSVTALKLRHDPRRDLGTKARPWGFLAAALKPNWQRELETLVALQICFGTVNRPVLQRQAIARESRVESVLERWVDPQHDASALAAHTARKTSSMLHNTCHMKAGKAEKQKAGRVAFARR